MTIAELIVKSSIHVILVKQDENNPEVIQKPIDFGSGFLLNYLNRTFFVSVSHVTDKNGLITTLETNLPFDEKGPILKTIKGICYFDMINFKNVDPVKSSKDFEDLLQNGKRLDIAFAEITEPIELMQPEIDFGKFKVEAGSKLPLFMDDATTPVEGESYGFYGLIGQDYIGKYLKMTPTFKYGLVYHQTTPYGFYKFLAPSIVRRKDFEGCSGAPILDSQGRIAAIACKVASGTKIIYGFPIQECKRLIDISLKTGIL
ncbi:MAG: hypothetical protein IBJ09_01025 [Bacteroidia bacterium]|nr:hypothetical protein [Bacteroidia bacterium]